MREKLACQCRKNWSADAGKAEMLAWWHRSTTGIDLVAGS
jgi:hypothetical protein